MRVYGIAVVLTAFLVTAAVASPPPYTDADVLALEISDSLLAPGAMVSQISQDLNAIHAAFPGFVGGVDDIHARPSWAPGVILVKLTAPAWADYLGGTYTGLDDLNAQYGPVAIGIVSSPGRLLILEFQALYNPPVLDDIYAQASGVEFSEPNFYYGDGNDITSSQVGRYLFKRGWGDCPSGCIYKHFWDFQVIDGNVTLLNEYGNPTLTGVGDTPSPAQLVGNAPNPFDRATDVAYRVSTPTHVQLRVYDASGRLVKDLHDGPANPGAHVANWDGTDESGRRVASGVYFCRLVATGVTQTHKMLVIR